MRKRIQSILLSLVLVLSMAAACGIIVYADTGDTVRVIFVENYEGSTAHAPISLEKGSIFPEEEIPNMTRDGYDFTGWYTSADCETEFDFSQPVNEMTYIYAGWERNSDILYYQYLREVGKYQEKALGNATEITSTTTSVSSGTYYISGEYEATTLTVNGDVSIVLLGSANATYTDGIRISDEGSLSIYADTLNEDEMGSLTATASSESVYPGIGSYDDCIINIHGGKITASGGVGAGIGTSVGHDIVVARNDNRKASAQINICGGIIHASSASGCAIGTGDTGLVTNYKTTLTANITIDGGTVIASTIGGIATLGMDDGLGANPDNRVYSNITINGGSVEIESGLPIRCDKYVQNGGTVNVKSKMSAPVIKCNGNFELYGGNLTAENTIYNLDTDDFEATCEPPLAIGDAGEMIIEKCRSEITVGKLYSIMKFDAHRNTYYTNTVEDISDLTEINGAQTYKLVFKGLDHHKIIQTTDAEDAVFDEDGNMTKAGHEAYYKCSCGKYFSDSEGKKEIEDLEDWLEYDGKRIFAIMGKEATCTETGIKPHYFNGNAYSEEKDFSTAIDDIESWKEDTNGGLLPALGHDYGQWEEKTPATCSDTGLESRTCSRCSAEETRDIDPLGHDLGDWVVKKAATCEEAGLEEQKCSRCSYAPTREIKALGHDLTYAAENNILTVTCSHGDSCTMPGGKASLTVTAVSDTYSGMPQSAEVTEENWKLEKPAVQYEGTDGTTYSSDTPPVNAGTYQASVTAGGKTAICQYEISKAEPVIISWPTAADLVYGQKLKDSALTGGESQIEGTFAWQNGNTAPGVGQDEYKVVFTPADEANYDIVKKDVELKTVKMTPELSYDQGSASLAAGDSLELVLTYTGDGVITAKSSNEETVTASVSGNTVSLTGVAEGNATISIHADESDNCESADLEIQVTVNKKEEPAEPAVPEFTLDKTSLTMTEGESSAVTITYTGDGAITAKSSNESAATAAVNGNTVTVTAAGAGSATVTISAAATASYQAVSKEISVTVNKKETADDPSRESEEEKVTPVSALTFKDSDTYNITSAKVGVKMTAIDLSGAVKGGKAPYVFTAEGLPKGIAISNAGVLSGTFTKAAAASTAKIIVTDAAGASQTITIAVAKVDAIPITSVKLGKTKYVYNGKIKKPTVTVKAGSKVLGETIKKSNSNVKITYASGRKNVGKYKVTVKGTGNYTGTITKTFKIYPKATAITKISKGKKSFTVKWKKKAKVTGYQIRYSTKSSMAKSKKITIKGPAKISKKVSKLKAKKKYYVQVRTYKTVNKSKYYSKWSKKKAVTTK